MIRIKESCFMSTVEWPKNVSWFSCDDKKKFMRNKPCYFKILNCITRKQNEETGKENV